jgi:hypothetical protein
MLFTTNISKENIYWHCNGKFPHCLNTSLGLNPLITLIILFWIQKINILKEELPQKIIA